MICTLSLRLNQNSGRKKWLIFYVLVIKSGRLISIEVNYDFYWRGSFSPSSQIYDEMINQFSGWKDVAKFSTSLKSYRSYFLDFSFTIDSYYGSHLSHCISGISVLVQVRLVSLLIKEPFYGFYYNWKGEDLFWQATVYWKMQYS